MDTTTKLKHWFRVRCREYLERGPMAWSLTHSDTMNEDGTITEGATLAVYGSITCHRLRWHGGACRP